MSQHRRPPRWIAPLISWATIVIGVSIPGDDLTGVSSGMGEIGHAAGFLIFAATLVFWRTRIDRVVIALLIGGAVLSELIQLAVPGRVPSLSDVAIDLAGAALAILVIAVCRRPDGTR